MSVKTIVYPHEPFEQAIRDRFPQREDLQDAARIAFYDRYTAQQYSQDQITESDIRVIDTLVRHHQTLIQRAYRAGRNKRRTA